MPTKPIRFDSDRIVNLTAAPVDIDPDKAALAARYVTRTLGDQAGEVLRALGLAPADSKPWRRA